MNADAMTPNQHARAADLLNRARDILLMLDVEPLGLNAESRDALRSTKNQLEDFRLYVLDQPTEGVLL